MSMRKGRISASERWADSVAVMGLPRSLQLAVGTERTIPLHYSRTECFVLLICYASMQRAGPMSGRRAQAARNDDLILDAAREVFIADPGAPISAVAERAGVGISA